MRVVFALPRFCRLLSHFPAVTYSNRAMSSNHKCPVVVISGPSGSGKSTLLSKLFQEFEGCFAFSVSHTTRGPRKNETAGIDYNFVTRDEFKQMLDENQFLEHAEFSGNCYGTSKKAVMDIEKTGKICILDVEVNGVKNIKGTDLNAKYIFVKPPSVELLEKRLRDRGTESEDSLQRRLASVKEALEYAEQDGSYNHVIINDDLDVAYKSLRGVLLPDVEQLKKDRMNNAE